ncbi:MAG TPA: endonuclease/exonuclease/phosphatase family protein [Verrucomicrobiae bacterium]
MQSFRVHRWIWVFTTFVLWLTRAPAATFRIASYNLEGYLDIPTETRAAKAAESKSKIRESICAMRPDVIALQEMGSTNALLELRASLKTDGLDLPYWEHLPGYDTNIHLAVLSRFPFNERRPHTNDNFLLDGRRFRVSRGFLEVDIQVRSNYSFTLMTAHLKSKRAVASGDEAEIRLEEAKLLREKIDTRLMANPNLNLVVLGDFNDTIHAPSTRMIVGRYRNKLIDTWPSERNGDSGPSPVADRAVRTVAWTHYYGQDDTYSRVDFLLLSPGMAREWQTNDTYVLSLPGWGVGSDHRPVTAAFEAEDQ